MNNRRTVIVFFLMTFFFAAFAVGRPDDHIAGSSIRSYMGRTTPPAPHNIWIAADKTSYQTSRMTIITRSDLGVTWIIIPQQKKYLEEPLAPSSSAPAGEEQFRIQEYGFDYQPVYDWTLSVSEEPETVDGKSCVKVTAVGEADYATEIREFWVTKDVPINLGRYYEKIVKPDASPEWRSLYENNAVLRQGLAVKSVTTSENPIAPTMIFELKVIRVEIAAAPPGTYDVPAGFQKVKTRDELFAR